MDDLSICNQMKALQQKLAPLIPQLKLVSASPSNLMKNLLLAGGYSQQQVTDLMTKIYVSSSCTNNASINQINLIDTTKCATVLGCAKRVDPAYVSALQKKFGLISANEQLNVLAQLCTFNNITQSNDATVQQTCIQSQTIKGLNDLPFSPAIQAIINSLTNAAPLDCKLYTNKTQTNISKAYSECKNTAYLNQSNIVLCAPGPSNQTNVANILQTCVQNSSTDNTIQNAVKTSQIDSGMAGTDQTMTTNTTNDKVVIITATIVAVVIIASLLVVVLSSKKKSSPKIAS
jgi:hypothetical protein